MQKLEPFYIADGDVKQCSYCRKQVGNFSKTVLSYDPVILLLWIYTKEMKTGTQTIYTPTCIDYYIQWPKGGNIWVSTDE